MAEPDSIQPTMDTNGSPEVAAARNDAAVQGEVGFPRTPGPEAPADSGSPPAVPDTRPEEPPTRGSAEQVGRYRVLGEIGRGGMGAVLRSRDTELGRDL